MQKLSNILLALGLFLIAYAGFSSLYGERGVAFKVFRSSDFMSLGIIVLLLSIIASIKELSKKV